MASYLLRLSISTCDMGRFWRLASSEYAALRPIVGESAVRHRVTQLTRSRGHPQFGSKGQQVTLASTQKTVCEVSCLDVAKMACGSNPGFSMQVPPSRRTSGPCT